jgi:hypothetical protein
MPIWLELLVLALLAYAAGLALGWLLWGRALTADGERENGQ